MIQPQAPSLLLPDVAQVYLYAYATCGAYPALPFANGNLLTGVGSNGLNDTAVAATPSPWNGFSTGCSSYSIEGVGVGGFAQGTVSDAVFVPPDTSGATWNFTFNLTAPSLVVFLVTSGGQCCLDVSGIPRLFTLAEYDLGGPGTGLLIAESTLNSGTYTMTEESNNNGPGSMDRADIIAEFAFAPDPGTGTGGGGSGSSATGSQSGYLLIAEIALPVLAVAAVAFGLLIRRHRRTKEPPLTTPDPQQEYPKGSP